MAFGAPTDSRRRPFLDLVAEEMTARFPAARVAIMASDTLTGPAVDSTMGWSDWADGGVEVHMVPGNHANMMYQPHVGTLAAALTACLKLAKSPTDEQETRKIDQ